MAAVEPGSRPASGIGPDESVAPIGMSCADWCAPFIRDGVARYVANESLAMMEIVGVGGTCIPVVINAGDSHGCYITSPSCHYCSYAADEVARKSGTRLFGRAAAAGLRALGRWTRGEGFDRVVTVNNWLLSTNPQIGLKASEVRDLTGALLEKFPDHAFVFRTVERGRGSLASDLESAGWWAMPNRRVFAWDPAHFARLSKKCREKVRLDAGAIDRHGYQRLSLAGAAGAGGAGRLREFYRELYIGKHSGWNPDFTADWFERFVKHAGIGGVCLGRDGGVDGFVSWFEEPDRITGLILGYDRAKTSIPLYRMLVATLLSEAQRCGKAVFLSSGAGRFKRLRGAEPKWEFEYVYDRHLPWRRRIPWRVFRALYGRLAEGVYDSGDF